ncbi:MAG: 23S rRNA (pseudouridine(1915)-N(3))-methyltransferase RlmH [Hydrogenophilus sp.]|nr:23S rRNA (pseudouridine(1915)-N(3))-methyltransferase RlmH [Hydrogenophilus sp.]
MPSPWLVLAISDRPPRWVEEATAHYLTRLPRDWPITLHQIRPEARRANLPSAVVKARETQRLLARIPPRALLIALDERGALWTTPQLAEHLTHWRAHPYPVVFAIGGPDGHSPELIARAHHTWSLSPLTLPHFLVRILLAEALYRAYTLLTGHPYHRP